MCYIGHILEAGPCFCPLVALKGSRENIEQGRGSSTRRLCHRKRVKRVLPRRLRLAAVQQNPVPGLPPRPPRGRRPRARPRKPQKLKEVQCPARLPKLPLKPLLQSPPVRRPPRLLRR